MVVLTATGGGINARCCAVFFGNYGEKKRLSYFFQIFGAANTVEHDLWFECTGLWRVRNR
jgi:hypothetical protein